jgi:tRNA(fMet)-specific endonuclease VapC
MAHYLLDTNHASTLVTFHHPLRQKVLAAIAADHDFSVAVPVITESVFGISLLPRAAANRQEWQKLRQEVTCFALDEIDALAAAELQLDLRKKGIQLKTVDALIATVALRYDLILLTSDQDFLAIPKLRHENWR